MVNRERNSTLIVLLAVVTLCFLMAANLAIAGTIELPRTGQKVSYGVGDDGEWEIGVPWPVPRFNDNGDQTVTDNLTGLIWTKDANSPGPACYPPEGHKNMTWQEALTYIKCLNDNSYLGHNDWRLPNINELYSLVDKSRWNPPLPSGHPFANVQTDFYWSSTTYSYDNSKAWLVIMGGGYSGYVYNYWKSYDYYVWPVRAGQCGDSAVCLPKTGQTTSYATGDDGDLKTGVAWPNPRFTDTGADTVIDNLTGLIWTKDAGTPGPSVCGPGTSKRWQNALDHVKCLNDNLYLGHNDWRLPNINELHSLVDRSKVSPALPSEHPFANVHSYWSSSSYAGNTSHEWYVSINDGSLSYFYNSSSFYVWPVRGGYFGESVLSVTFSAPGGHGTISCQPTAIRSGSSVCTISPASGYYLVNLTDNGLPVSGAMVGDTYTFTDLTIDHVIEATFAEGSHTLDLPVTGQKMCYKIAGDEVACSVTGQDGSFQAGISWPVPRFNDNGDQTVTDNLTGLVWAMDATVPGPSACSPGTSKTWQAALEYVACLNTNNYLGHADWRLPNINELYSLVDRSTGNPALPSAHPFANVQPDNYWSSTSHYDSSNASYISMASGSVGHNSKATIYYVWPVRAGQCGVSGNSAICIPKTGQVTSHATGDDGDLQTGVAWPTPRFVDNSDETVTDNLTGLMWTKTAGFSGSSECIDRTWQGALDYINCLNDNEYLGHTDWRLPNINELKSLVDYSTYSTFDPALPAGHPFVSGSSSNRYWSSSTYSNDTSKSWHISFGNGFIGYDAKSSIASSNSIWPVRAGYRTSSTITISASVPGGNGTLSCPSSVSGSPFFICTITASSGYYLANLTDNGKLVTGTVVGDTYTFADTTINHVIEASFVAGDHMIDLPRTGQVDSHDTNPHKDDGGIQAGAIWPEARFGVNSDAPDNGNTITDHLTGLVWMRDAGTPTLTLASTCIGGTLSWQSALDYVKCLNDNNYLGHNDWRLPNINELDSLVNLGQANMATWLNSQGFSNVQASDYVSSTIIKNTWGVSMGDGRVYMPGTSKFYVWPVRAGQCTSSGSSAICLPKTGQTVSYATGDDGDIQAGAAWPSPRFHDNNDQTVTDNLTGLMWTKNVNTPTYGICVGGSKTWQGGLDYVACLNKNNYLGHSDWRLPNRKELLSLIDRSSYGSGSALPVGHPFSKNMPNLWSSSTDASATYYAWYVQMGTGWGVDSGLKTGSCRVWPVRGGQVHYSITPSIRNGSGHGSITNMQTVLHNENATFTVTPDPGYMAVVRGTCGGALVGNTYTTGAISGPCTVLVDFVQPSSLFINLPRTGQTGCYDSSGNAIDCTGTGQDGDLMAGVAWPNPRFMDNGDGTITDKLTGLIWLKDADCITKYADPAAAPGLMWRYSLDFVSGVNNGDYPLCGAGYADWRLPNIIELESIVNAQQSDASAWLVEQGFSNVKNEKYWTSDSSFFGSLDSGATKWAVSLMDGSSSWNDKISTFRVWLVRSGQSAGVIQLPRTGVTASYEAARSGEDGDIQEGVAWPIPRFTDNGEGTVTDSLTGLIWLKDAHCIKTNYPALSDDVDYDGFVIWQHALDFVSGINDGTYSNCGAGHADWRLPNQTELLSLIDFSKFTPALPAGQPFTNVQGSYWSSTTDASHPSSAKTVGPDEGWLSTSEKKGVVALGVWPVRSGYTPIILTILKNGEGSGTVTSLPEGINCGSVCSRKYEPGTQITFTVSTNTGSVFTGWSGGECSGTGTCQVSMDASKSVTATFALLVNGLCGISNGQTLTGAPSSNLCSAGTASSVSGNGPWTWICAGVNGGTSASCSANIQTWSVTPSAGAGGSINPNTAQTVKHGSPTTFAVIPNNGYKVATVTGCGGSLSGGTYTTGAVTSACTVTASFEAVTRIITATAGAGGSISPNTSQTVKHGSTTTFTVTPNNGYTVAAVTGCGGSLSGSTYTTGVTTADCIVTATFAADAPTVKQYTLTINKGGTGAGSVTATGIDCGTDCTEVIKAGGPVTLTASADSGSTFTGWAGGGCLGTDTCTVTVNSDTTVTAAFTPDAPEGSFNLTVIMDGTGSGEVSAGASVELTCDNGICSATVEVDRPLALTATPTEGTSLFSSPDGWDGCDSIKSGKCIIKMTEDKIITATFIEFPKLTITVDTAESLYGIGTGQVIATGIKCSNADGTDETDCDQTYNKKTKVTLKAVADKGSQFSTWDGCDTTNNSICVVNINSEDKEITVTFEPIPQYALTVTKSGNGSGTVTSSKGLTKAISCNGACTQDSANYQENKPVRLTAKTDNGARFTGWSGHEACEGKMTATCTFKMDADYDITAGFDEIPTYTVTVTPAGSGTGTITGSPKGKDGKTITCGTNCSEDYVVNKPVTVILKAKPAKGSKLTGWGGDASEACTAKISICKIARVDSNMNVTAIFGKPAISLSTDSIDFGNVTRKTTSTQTFTITNNGDADMKVASKLSGKGAAMYKLYNSVTQKPVSKTTIPAGESLTVEVRFKPTTTGSKPATLTISSDDTDNPKTTVSLAGTGI